VLALHVACFENDSLILVAAPSQRQSVELVRTIRKLHSNVGGGVPEMTGDAVQKIELANGSCILALPGSEDGKTIRGLGNCRLCLVDEASRIPVDLLKKHGRQPTKEA
jgi:hypothetical protein